MSGTLAALTPASVRTPELRHQYERLLMRLEDPYFRAMLTYLALGDWNDVLEEEHIPLRERLAIGLHLLQNYADRTGDVQTAAILGAYVHPHQLKDARAERWLDVYRDLLDGWKLFHHRCQLDIDRRQM